MEVSSIESRGGIDQLPEGEASLPHPYTGSPSFASGHPEEDWTKISDLTERRRIQNRIAQRNYRKKIKERMQFLEGKAAERGGTDTNNIKEQGEEQAAVKAQAGSHRTSTTTKSSSPGTVVAPVEAGSSFPEPGSPESPSASHSQVSSQDKADTPLDKPLIPDIEFQRPLGPARSSSSPAGDAGTDSTATWTPPWQPKAAVPNDVIALRLTDPEPSGRGPSGPKRVQKHLETFQCSLCPRRFTRAYNLRSHLRTHTDEHPFACAVCGKTFARKYDCKRHEGLHSGEKKFVCKGGLKDGGQWGCGRRFARADALGRHLRSEAGRICTKPLIDEESHERLVDGRQRLSHQFVAVDFQFPAALLAQYPALANLNWTAGNVQDEVGDDRSRLDSSDYESDDAGYVSGPETGFGSAKIQQHASSFHDNDSRSAADGGGHDYRRAVDADGFVWTDPQKIVDDSFSTPADNTETFTYTSQDQAYPTDTGASDPGRQSTKAEGSRPALNRQNVDKDYTTPLEECPASLHSDDDMSLRSFTGSVFDTGSLVSSASSFHGNSHSMVASLVDILVRDPSMDSLLAMTTSEFGANSGRFTRNFSRILKSYSRHLRQAAEGSTKDGRESCYTAAKFVRNARYQVSNLIASRYNERAPTAQDLKHRDVDLISRHLSQPLPLADNDEPSSNEESSGDEVDLAVGDLKHFLVSGEPFRHLKRNLRSLIIPDEFLYCIYESVAEFLDLTLADRRTTSFAPGLRRALAGGRDISSDLALQVRVMASELRAECTGMSQLDAANFLETYSQYISVVAIDQAKTLSTSHNPSVEDTSPVDGKGSNTNVSSSATVDPKERLAISPALSLEEVLEQAVADTLPLVYYVDLVPHRPFLASSAAFASFLDALHDLAHPSFFSEARRSVKATIRSAEASEDRPLALEGQRLLPILAEMQSCLQQDETLITFSPSPDEARATVLDRVKLAIEASTAAEWDWWPMQPPNHPAGPGRAKISWQCSCGTKRHESTLPCYASELQRIADNFPLSPGAGGSTALADRSTSPLSEASSRGTRTTQSENSSSTNISGGQSAGSSLSRTNSAITPPDVGDGSVVDFSTGPRRYVYVFLLVKASEYVLDTIDVSSMKARDFFQALRASYNERRGLWRRAFSVFVYNHCDFIKIIKPEPDTFMPGEQKFELPPDHDDQYHYRPRPTYSAPITKHMFRHYFYGCYDGGALLHRLHARGRRLLLPLAAPCRVRSPPAELLDHLPKRDRRVLAAAAAPRPHGRVEACYGLAARERRSLARVAAYLCLAVAPALWFALAWLLRRGGGGGGDLQDATVPMTLVLSALSVLWAVVYSGSDVRKDYGDD